MDARERYYWDLTGFLVLRKVLTDDEVKAANDAIDYLGDRVINGTDEESDFLRKHARPRIEANTLTRTSNNYPFFLSLKKPHCEPYRKMISHPALLSRLRVMCGRGFRLDHGPQFIGGIKGTRGGSLHGAGEPHRPYVGYNHQAVAPAKLVRTAHMGTVGSNDYTAWQWPPVCREQHHRRR